MFASHTNVDASVVSVGAADVTVRSVRTAISIACDVMFFCGLLSKLSWLSVALLVSDYS